MTRNSSIYEILLQIVEVEEKNELNNQVFDVIKVLYCRTGARNKRKVSAEKRDTGVCLLVFAIFVFVSWLCDIILIFRRIRRRIFHLCRIRRWRQRSYQHRRRQITSRKLCIQSTYVIIIKAKIFSIVHSGVIRRQMLRKSDFLAIALFRFESTKKHHFGTRRVV